MRCKEVTVLFTDGKVINYADVQEIKSWEVCEDFLQLSDKDRKWAEFIRKDRIASIAVTY